MEDYNKNEFKTLLNHKQDSVQYIHKHKADPVETSSGFERFLRKEKQDILSCRFWRACFAEFFGSFLLCFYTCGLMLAMPDQKFPSLLQVALAVGLFFAVMITALGSISGGQLNPVVSISLAICSQMTMLRAIVFIVFQCAGCVAGSLVLKFVIPKDMVGELGVIQPPDYVTEWQAIVMEILITSVLIFVILSMVDSRRTDLQHGCLPVIVGLTVILNILLGANVSGACMNPARALGPAVVMGNYTNQWIYWVGPISGGVLGSFLYDKIFSVDATARKLCRCCVPLGPLPDNISFNIKV